MERLTIDASVEEELLYIGRALGTAGLQGRIGQRIDGVNTPDIDLARYPSGAEKAAHKYGLTLEVSWAEISRKDVMAYEAALIQRYLAQHCCMPSFNPPSGQLPVLGNARVERLVVPPQELDRLEWSDWQVIRSITKRALPTNPGVYRIRACP